MQPTSGGLIKKTLKGKAPFLVLVRSFNEDLAFVAPLLQLMAWCPDYRDGWWGCILYPAAPRPVSSRGLSYVLRSADGPGGTIRSADGPGYSASGVNHVTGWELKNNKSAESAVQ